MYYQILSTWITTCRIILAVNRPLKVTEAGVNSWEPRAGAERKCVHSSPGLSFKISEAVWDGRDDFKILNTLKAALGGYMVYLVNCISTKLLFKNKYPGIMACVCNPST